MSGAWILAALLSVAPPVSGATSPAVTQANVQATICRQGYTRTVRPPLRFSENLKRRLYRHAHATGGLRAFELDHLVPLELGGAPRDLKNLWLEPIGDARVKDRLENRLRVDVCAGRVALQAAQTRMEAWGR